MDLLKRNNIPHNETITIPVKKARNFLRGPESKQVPILPYYFEHLDAGLLCRLGAGTYYHQVEIFCSFLLGYYHTVFYHALDPLLNPWKQHIALLLCILLYGVHLKNIWS